MKARIVLSLIGFLFAGCTAAQPASPASTPTSRAAPTLTLTAAPKVMPSPTVTDTPTPVPLPAGRAVVFDESADRPLAGTLYGDGETVILLANMSIGGEKQWAPFVAAVDKEKFTTVTFHYRDIDKPGEDMDLLLGWLREAGFERVICIGASMGTRACSGIALEPEIAGLVLIAGAVHHTSVAQATYPKLFISGAGDRSAFDIQTGYERAAEPRELLLFEDNRLHGTDLFSSKDREAFLAALLDFVNPLSDP